MDNLFGIDDKIVRAALIKGIKIKKDGVFINTPGFVALLYMVQLNKFILTYGTGTRDAGYVLVEDYDKEWVIAGNGKSDTIS
jgi:hypothetical protein